MVKTTILLDDDLYRKLVQESVKRYGTTKKLSKLINEKLRQSPRAEGEEKGRKQRLRLSLGRMLSEKELQEKIESGWDETTRWNA